MSVVSRFHAYENLIHCICAEAINTITFSGSGSIIADVNRSVSG